MPHQHNAPKPYGVVGRREHEEPPLSQLPFPHINGYVYGMPQESNASFGDRFAASAI